MVSRLDVPLTREGLAADAVVDELAAVVDRAITAVARAIADAAHAF